MSAGTVGLAVSSALSITFGLSAAVKQFCDIEMNIVSVERLKEYAEKPCEEIYLSENEALHVLEQPQGEIEFRNFCARYRAGLELVLKNLNAHIFPGEKIGIVGRTGAGKSSMTAALMRLIDSAGGEILIDKTNIASVPLETLRRSITIIPQDPALFSGSLRFNLDPFDEHDDMALWKALELTSMKDFVTSLNGGLNYALVEGGGNISVGQRQLLCLARAMLRSTKILILDEATAAVDSATDVLIQVTIRSQFKDSTVLTIAHRLNTILDYDRVMVLDKGKIVEFDAPAVLSSCPNSLFSTLLAHTNARS